VLIFTTAGLTFSARPLKSAGIMETGAGPSVFPGLSTLSDRSAVQKVTIPNVHTKKKTIRNT
jgi:hypothetical protein